MSKFDVIKLRKLYDDARWDTPAGGTCEQIAERREKLKDTAFVALPGLLCTIDALETRIAVLERVRDAATLHARTLDLADYGQAAQALVTALAACDDGERVGCDESNSGSISGAAGTAKRSPKPERREP